MISWFNNLEDKDMTRFIQADIDAFYPNISENLLNNALKFAENHVRISTEEKEIILNTKKNLLFSDGKPWAKKGNSDWDVTMGSWDGAEVCELCGLYLLSQVQHLNVNIGMYRDDILCATKQRPQQVERTKQKLCKIFNDNGLNIHPEPNTKVANFLYVTLDLNDGEHRPYRKPNNKLVYVHSQSNHPPATLKNIPLSIERRLSELSSNEQIFNNSKKPYQDALDECDYKHSLKYSITDHNDNVHRKNRRRNIVWFNPPFSKNVSTNLAKEFFKIMEKCFPSDHKLNKIINRNCVKLSYSCMTNMGNIIKKHNSNILSPPDECKDCDCESENVCPVNGECRKSNVIYQATITTEKHETHTYTGLSMNTFKERWTQHLSNFRVFSPKPKTTLSKKVWELKRDNIVFDVTWRIKETSKPYTPMTKTCNLCTSEIFHILFNPQDANLNSRTEIKGHCRHWIQHRLSNFKT